MSSKVFFTDFRTCPGNNQLDKLEKLVRHAGIETIDFKDKFVAIKIHVGEWGNMAYLRPNYAATIVKIVKELGGKPFLTDANTLYSGFRSNAIDHLNTANLNGYSPMSTGAQFIVADGLKGLDYKEIPINGEYCKAPKIAAAIAEADILLSISHVKGHEMAGFGGALKNLGMGTGSVAGKKEMHCNCNPEIDPDKCRGCGSCAADCAQDAITIGPDNIAHIDHEKCVGCGQCIATCQFEAAWADRNESMDGLNCKIAEYAKAAINGKPNFNISIITDVSPECDCWNYNDVPVVPNIGMAASFDPVALDCACSELVNSTPVMDSANSLTDHYSREECHHAHNHWDLIHPDTNWRSCVEHGEKIGLGTRDYELVSVE